MGSVPLSPSTLDEAGQEPLPIISLARSWVLGRIAKCGLTAIRPLELNNHAQNQLDQRRWQS
jgi:hypothetical protein